MVGCDRCLSTLCLGETFVPKCVQGDEGKESEDICKKLTEKYGFKMFHTYNHEIKTLIGKLKIMVRQVLAVTKQFHYARYMQSIVDRYNEAPHRALLENLPQDTY